MTEMSAVEVLEWLWKHNSDGEYEKVFGADYVMFYLIEYFTPQEIVDCIEKYEAEKKHIEHTEPPKEEVNCEICKYNSSDNFSANWEKCHVCIINSGNENNFTPIPKEEKHKIEKFSGFGLLTDFQVASKINELVDAVNELRGV